jgi:hypothetical protein
LLDDAELLVLLSLNITTTIEYGDFEITNRIINTQNDNSERALLTKQHDYFSFTPGLRFRCALKALVSLEVTINTLVKPNTGLKSVWQKVNKTSFNEIYIKN